MDQHARDVREGWLTVETFYFDVSVRVIVELVAECFITLTTCNVVVRKDAFVEVAVHGKHVAIADGDLLPFAEPPKMYSRPSHDAASHINHPLVSVEATDLLSSHFHHDAVGLAHHRGNLLSRELFHCCYPLPGDRIERRGREIWQEFCSLDHFTAERPGSCDAVVIVAAFSCLP